MFNSKVGTMSTVIITIIFSQSVSTNFSSIVVILRGIDQKLNGDNLGHFSPIGNPFSSHLLLLLLLQSAPFSCPVNTMPLHWKKERDRKKKKKKTENVTPANYKTTVVCFLSPSILSFTIPSHIIAVRHISQSKVQRFWC